MTVSQSPNLQTIDQIDESLIELVEELTNRLQRGDENAVDEMLTAHPQYAEQLRQLLPSIEGLAQWGRLEEESDPRASQSKSPPPAMLGDFRIVREIGRGGMGVVYEAEQISLQRRVALKVLPFAAALDERQLQRFRNEAQAAAHLHHQNIVPVYAVGTERGVHYYAMQYIEGRTLADIVAEQRQHHESTKNVTASPNAVAPVGEASSPPGNAASTDADCLAGFSTEQSTRSPAYFRTVADLGIQAAEALAHAHDNDVIHRDIKPANLIVDARGRLWIADFGLAHIRGNSNLTLTGDLVGTLRYMSPEQALGQREQLDQRTDLYSLGATLYELMTQRPAVNGTDRHVILQEIIRTEPRPPRRFNNAIPGELETIVLKLLAKNPDERYRCAKDVAEDLRCFLDNRPIKAKKPSLWLRTKKWAARHRRILITAIVSIALGLLLTTVVLAVSLQSLATAYTSLDDKHNELKIANDNKNKALQEKEAALKKMKEVLALYGVTLADREMRLGNNVQADMALADCPQEYRNWEWNYLKRACNPERRVVRFSPDAWNALRAGFSPDGQTAIISDSAGTIRSFDLATGREVANYGKYSRTYSHLVSPDGNSLLVGLPGGLIGVYDLQTGKLRRFMRTERPKQRIRQTVLINRMHISRNGDKLILAKGKYDKGVEIWNVADGTLLHRFDDAMPYYNAVALNAAGDTAAYGTVTMGRGNPGLQVTSVIIHVIDAATGKTKYKLTGHANRVMDLDFSPDGKLLASVGLDSTVMLWDLDAGKSVARLHGHSGVVDAVAFSPDGTRLATAGADKVIRLWDLKTRSQLAVLHGHLTDVHSLRFLPGGDRLLSAAKDRTVRLWDLTRNGADFIWKGPVPSRGVRPNLGRPLFFDGNENRLFAISDGRSADMRTSETWLSAWPFRDMSPPTVQRMPGSLQGFSNGKAAVSLATLELRVDPKTRKPDRLVRLWKTDNQDKVVLDKTLAVILPQLQFLDDGTCVHVSGDKLVDSQTGNIIASPVRKQAGTLTAVNVAAGLVVYTGTKKIEGKSGMMLHSAEFYDLHNRKLLYRIQDSGPYVPIRSSLLPNVQFSPDNKRVLFTCRGQPLHPTTVHIIEAATGRVTGQLKTRNNSYTFSPDGKYILDWNFTRLRLDWTAQTNLRDGVTGAVIKALGGHGDSINSVAFSPDSTRLVTAGNDGTIKLWDTRSGREILTLRGHQVQVRNVTFSPKGNYIASSDAHGVIRVWDGSPWQDRAGRVVTIPSIGLSNS